MHPDSAALVWDARRAAVLVQQFTADMSFDDYAANDLVRSAVERQLTIVGEAVNRLSRVDPETAAAVPELPRIVAFRNILVHNYVGIDNALVWQLVTTRLPSLVAALDELQP